MSPDITSVVRPSDPVSLIREAVNAATGMGLVVATVPDLGVHCTSQHPPHWEHTGRTDCISPLGAVLIARQPPIPSADDALSHALGVSTLWVIGFDDGCARQPPSTAFANGPARLLYAQGFEAGTTFRAALHRRQAVPAPRDLDEVTERVHVETPRSVIAELISSLTVAQVLEALADSIPGRGWSEDRTVDTVEDLRELAAEYRADAS